MLYAYTQSARASGKALALKGAVLLCLGLTFAAVFWWTAIIPLLMVLPILIGLAMLYDGGMRLVRGGAWHIQYDGERLNWQAPAFAEPSFSAHNRDIGKIVAQVKLTHKRRMEAKRRIRYMLVTSSADTYPLSEQSGVDVTALVEVMREHGVPVEEVLTD